ncbi:hypothetical protein [Ottowia sp.]|uniref:hypothetical protein n=1 Tax=Ottowia sp. TaxID=1898956 RepID=UPI0025EF944B|nr:hypothetical protein [Ottowia sp.]MBK6616035.1 hypothetical protein [Ottowia sp.]
MKSLLLAATLASASCFASAESSEVVDLASRPQVIQRTLVERPAGQPTGATLVLLMGANGQLGIFPNGSLRRDSHFLACAASSQRVVPRSFWWTHPAIGVTWTGTSVKPRITRPTPAR